MEQLKNMDIKDIYNAIKIDEDAIMAGGDASPVGDISTTADSMTSDIMIDKGTDTSDVLGKNCDHNNKGGFMGKDCFHMPFNVLGSGKYLKRYNILKKKKKNPYLSGSVIFETEADKKTLASISSISEQDILDFVNKNYDFSNVNALKAAKILRIGYIATLNQYLILLITNSSKNAIAIASYKDKLIRTDDDVIHSIDEIKKDFGKQDVWLVWNKLQSTNEDLIEDDSKENKVFDLQTIYYILLNAPSKYMNSQLHVGPYGRHIGDIKNIDEEGLKYNQLFLTLNKAHTSMHRGPVEGSMKVSDIIERFKQLLAKNQRYGSATVLVAEEIDPLSKQLGKTPTAYNIKNVEVAAIDGIWLRV